MQESLISAFSDIETESNVEDFRGDPSFRHYDIIAESVPRRKNVLRLLSSRECGFSQSHLIPSEYSAVKYGVMTVSNRFTKVCPQYCKFIKQNVTGDSFLAAYAGIKRSSLYNFSFRFTNEDRGVIDRPTVVDRLKVHRILNFPGTVTDFYKTDIRLHAISNSTIDNKVKNFAFFHSLNSDFDDDQISFENDHFYCTAFDTDRNIVVGHQGGVLLCELENPHNYRYLNMDRDVISIALSKNGNILCCGFSEHQMRVLDLRQPFTTQNQLCCPPIGASEIMILQNDNSMIVCDEHKRLFQVFLNERRVVAKYEGSSSTGRSVLRRMPTRRGLDLRTPPSLNEKLDILCCTALDNKTRIWSLSSGKLLQVINPPIWNGRVHSCIVANGDKGTVVILQNERVFIIEPSIKD